MAQWRRVLYSGSNADITSITASALPGITGGEKLVFVDANGQFYTSSKLYFTESNGGQLYFDSVGLNVHNITASGTPLNLTDGSTLLFIGNEGGFETTESMFYVSSSNALFFDGVISGSFIGDGSGLTGVIGTVEYPFANSLGLISSSGDNFEWSGSQRVDVQVHTASNGGIVFEDNGIRLDDNLTGNGLEWVSAGDYSAMQINLDGTSNLTSGLKLSADGLRISDNIDGNGLLLQNGVISIDTTALGGITANSQGIRLSTSLPGTGLKWADGGGGDYSVMQIDADIVVTGSTTISFRTGSNNLTITSSTDGVTLIDKGIQANLIDSPEFQYDLNTTLSGDFTFSDDLTIEGDVLIYGGNTRIRTENLLISPSFILLNSGSTAGDSGFFVQTSATKGAPTFFDYERNRWGVGKEDAFLLNTSNISILGTDVAAISTVDITSDDEATILASTPLFGTDANDRAGQIIITTAPEPNESPIYIYV
jgi:hypothetical protein